MIEPFLAKSNGTSLQKHTEDVLETVAALQNVYESNYPQDWWTALKYAALLHDAGKIDPKFIQKIKTRKYIASLPHSIFSLFFLRPELLPFEGEMQSLKHYIISAIVFHHWRDYFPDLFLGGRTTEINEQAEKCIEDKYFWEERINRLREELKNIAYKYGLNSEVLALNEVLIEYLSYNSLGKAGILVPPYTLSFLPARLREKAAQQRKNERLRIFLSGNLMRADHFASLVEDNPDKFNFTDIEIDHYPEFTDLLDALQKKLKTKDMWQADLIERKEIQNQNVILVAPTGAGKTEFAYLWGAGRKNMVALPMRTAVNGIWDRTRNLWSTIQYFSAQDVALLHGNASLELYQQTDMDLEGEIRPTMDMARQLSQPFIVCTADQIAPAALHYPGYERIFATLMNSCLIVDEVQAYDPRAAAIVTHLIKQNHYFGGKNLLMTATLPAFINNEVCEALEIDSQGKQFIRLFDEPEFSDRSNSTRHHIQLKTHDGDYEVCADEIISAAIKGQKVLVVMNTVKKAVYIYDLLLKKNIEKENIYLDLLHSRFTETHRQKKIDVIYDYMANNEKRNKQPCIIISTQMVEASLDLDADILFTDAAPADSLIQRMGRVFRRYSRSSGNNAPEEANVIIMINNKVPEDNNSEVLAPGVGNISSATSKAVYDLDLTMSSLLILMAAGNQNTCSFDLESVKELFSKKEWKDCFSAADGKKATDTERSKRIKALNKLLKQMSDSFVIDEVTKMTWVEITYQILVEAYNNKDSFPVSMGKYINVYYDTLELLNHGYCTDRKRDAERLFRNVGNINVIPSSMENDFITALKEWVRNNEKEFNYLKFASDIFPDFLVSSPAWHLNSNLARPVELHPLLEKLELEPRKFDKLQRWFKGIYWSDLNYSERIGLVEGERNDK